jgi:MGT family glycosyltransferase
MARIAVLPYPAYGHMTPALPMVAELVRRGHEVTCFASPAFHDRVGRTGARSLGYGVALNTTGAGRDLPTADEAARAPLRLLEETAAIVPAVRAAYPDEPPDLLVYDTTLWAPGRLLAYRWGVPTVQLSPTVASNEHFSLTREGQRFGEPIDPAHPALAEFVRRLGVHLDAQGVGVGLAEFFTGGNEFTVVFVSRSFQPAGETFDDRYVFAGPPGEPGPGQWTPPADGRAVVLITLGTTVNDQPSFFRTCAAAFAGLPWQVVLTLGARVDPSALGELPPNVEARQWIAHTDVLPHCAAFLCQGGMGSVMEALSFGVPMVVVPHGTEQRINAERIADLGLGRVLAHEAVTPQTVRDAILTLVADDGIRRRAAAMREDVRAAGGAAAAADAVESKLSRTLEASHP